MPIACEKKITPPKQYLLREKRDEGLIAILKDIYPDMFGKESVTDDTVNIVVNDFDVITVPNPIQVSYSNNYFLHNIAPIACEN